MTLAKVLRQYRSTGATVNAEGQLREVVGADGKAVAVLQKL